MGVSNRFLHISLLHHCCHSLAATAGLLPRRLLASAVLVSLSFVSAGCGDGEEQAPGAAASGETPAVANAEPTKTPSAASSGSSEKSAESGDERVEFKPLSLSGLKGKGSAGSDTTAKKLSPTEQIQSVISHLQPLQILLGQWRGTTRREYENFKAVDQHEWVWDLRTKPDQPALVIQSDKSPYVKSGRLTWDTTAQKFQLTTTDANGVARSFTGDYSEPVHEVVGSDDKLHKVFTILFDQEKAGSDGEQWQLAIAQQENNRYLLEVGKRRGQAAAFNRFDTVSTQREGTSLAASDTDYAEKTCIISEGLGTTEVTYKGRSYWVCCSGCRAAFDEDPEKWIALAAQRDKEKDKK
ncbi:MAG: hypothetical protein U0996_14365 [Planctomycetaceae bacterium]